MKRIIYIFILLIVAMSARSQRLVEKHIRCRDSSMNANISIEVGKNDSKMSYLVKGRLSTGIFKAILYDPEGKPECGFQLTADPATDGPEGAKGQMSGEVKLPLAGVWKLRLQTEHASGDLNYQIYFNKP